MNNQETHLALQPIVDIGSAEAVHYEALFRIRKHPRYWDSHVSMLKDAELSGWIHEIDLAMLKRVLGLLLRHNIRIAINLSPQTIQFHHREILGLFDAHADVVCRLIVEITEIVPIRDLAGSVEFVRNVRSLGATVALDDFGSADGHFDAAIVTRLCPDYLKIDRSVFEPGFGRQQTIGLALHLAAETGAKPIAEFIDTHDKLTFIKLLGIEFAQGELFGLAKLYCPTQFPLERGVADAAQGTFVAPLRVSS